LKSGETYELGKAWPVLNQKEGSKGLVLVGLIWLCPAEQDEDGATVLPPHYEIWGVPKSLLENFFNPAQRALFKTDPTELEVWKQDLFAQDLAAHKIVYRRNIYFHQVAYDEESWPTESALKEIIEQVINPVFAPEDDGDDEPPSGTVQVVPTNGTESKSAEPVA